MSLISAGTIAWHGWEQPVASAPGVVPVAAVVPVHNCMPIVVGGPKSVRVSHVVAAFVIDSSIGGAGG